MKILYRPEIDGLRAIAVGAVILYHAQINVFNYQIFKGGFIGVDIFFVISGYLITSIILKEIFFKKSLSLLSFYQRRIRRILPVLLFVILISYPFAFLYLLPSSFVDFSKSILYSLGFSSNFYFNYSGQEYDAEDSLLIPFLHTWSLSVEEQYYIIFPITLIIVLKFFKKYLIYFLFLGFFLSLGLAEWGSKNYPDATFYFIHSRIWELLAGSILAYFEISNSSRSKNHVLNFIFPSIGIFLIVLSILLFDDEMYHPSIYTFLPVVGASLIIWFSNKDEITTKILSTKLFVGIGLISYSLYLWHYPVFAFARMESLTPNFFSKLLVGLIILVLSIFSYYCIERPFRNKKFKIKKVIIFLFIVINFVSIFSFFVINKNGELNSINVKLEENIKSPMFEDECKFFANNSKFFKIERINNCKMKLGKFILIVGDSHADDLYNSISKVSDKNEFIIGLLVGGRPFDERTDYDGGYMNVLDFIKEYSGDIKYIFFTHKGSYFLKNQCSDKNYILSVCRRLPLNQNQIDKTFKYLSLLKELKNEIIFFGPHLEPNNYLNRKMIISALSKKDIDDNTNYDLLEVDKKLKEISKNKNINYLSKIDVINFNFKKDYIVGTNFTFSDTDHWNDFGEIYFGRRIILSPMIKNIFYP